MQITIKVPRLVPLLWAALAGIIVLILAWLLLTFGWSFVVLTVAVVGSGVAAYSTYYMVCEQEDHEKQMKAHEAARAAREAETATDGK